MHMFILFSLFSLLHLGNPLAWGRPNILVLMTDDQRYDSLQYMPNVQQLLVQKGTRFERFYASYPLCCPSRATFLTGQYAHNHGVLDNFLPLGGFTRLDHTNTLAVWLLNSGYYTGLIGKYLNCYYGGIPPGWSEWMGAPDPGAYDYYGYMLYVQGVLTQYGFGASDYQTDVYIQQAADFIVRQHQQRPGQPWFLWVSFLAPHDDRDQGIPGPSPAPRHLGMMRHIPLPRPPSFNEEDVSDKPALVRSFPLLTVEEIDRTQLAYWRTLETLLAVDDGVKRLYDTLVSVGQLQNTVIIFLSDNGLMFGEHRQTGAGAKIYPYEESVRVPMVIRHPRFPTPQVTHNFVVNVDLAPTILKLAQATPGRVMDGRSVMRLLHNPLAPWRSKVLLYADHPETGYTIQYAGVMNNKGYVYVEHQSGEKELYNYGRGTACMPSDPLQLNNQAGVACAQRVIDRMKTHLDVLKTCIGASCWR
jgi:N-acetylglucosamine-6-sulfatase